MSFRSSLSSTAPPFHPPQKLLVIRFLNAHIAQEAFDHHSYDMLYRIVMIISAIGKQLHTVIQSQDADPREVRTMEWYSACVMEGLEVLFEHFEAKFALAKGVAEELNDMAVKQPDRLMGMWELRMRSLHLPLGNEARLFRHLANHFDDTVYNRFQQHHRRKSENLTWALNGHFCAVKEALENLVHACTGTDGIVRELENELIAAKERLNGGREVQIEQHVFEQTAGSLDEQSTQLHPDRPYRPASGSLDTDTQPATARAATPHTPIDDHPPRLPPLPFQLTPEDPQALHPLVSHQAHDSGKQLPFNKSFSTVEDQVTHRGHFRNATVADPAYVANPPTRGLSQRRGRRAMTGSSIGIRRKSSVAKDVPRVFTGSFRDLESDVYALRLHKVNTPERPSSPVLCSSPETGASPTEVITRDFADDSGASSVCPSPGALLQRREAVISREVQWESRMVNGEMVRVRRPSDRQQQRALTIEGHSGGLEAWLRQHSPQQNEGDSPGSAVKRGSLRQRETTL